MEETKPPEKKGILEINGHCLIMPMEAATYIFSNLTKLEFAESRWDPVAMRNTIVVKPLSANSVRLVHLDEEDYALGKLVYKAEEMKRMEQQQIQQQQSTVGQLAGISPVGQLAGISPGIQLAGISPGITTSLYGFKK